MYLLARKEIKSLLKIVQKHTKELAASISDDVDADNNQETFKAGETAILLQILGQIKLDLGETQGALDLYERALQQCKAAEDSAKTRDDVRLQNLRDVITNKVQQIKRDADVSPSVDKEERLREELNALIAFGADTTEISVKKLELTQALLKKDPPDYVEAIRLSEEALEELQRTFGPSHNLTRHFETVIERGKDQYRRYLQNLRK